MFFKIWSKCYTWTLTLVFFFCGLHEKYTFFEVTSMRAIILHPFRENHGMFAAVPFFTTQFGWIIDHKFKWYK